MDKVTAEDIENALNRGEIGFHFQPKVSFLTGEIVGCEALIRWPMSDGNVIGAGAFIPQAEKSGFITDITTVTLPTLIDDIETLRAWRRDIQVAYNVSARDLQSTYLLKILRNAIGGHRINPGNIQIEITETTVLEKDERVNRNLNELIQLGIEIVMDDFGTGYSSLDTLSRMPFSAIKLDQGVIGRMSSDARSTHIIHSTLMMARALSLKTIAEGVENKATYMHLMAAGCDEMQGFWISKALPLSEFIEFCDKHTPLPTSSLGHLYSAWYHHNSYRRRILALAYVMSQTNDEERSDTPKSDLVHSAARCKLALWHDSKAKYPDIDIEEPHRRMHAIGEELIKRIMANDDAATIEQALARFLDCSKRVEAAVSELVGNDFGAILLSDDKTPQG